MISDGTVTAVEDGYVLRFEFEVEAPPSEVWSCLTTSEGIAGWLGEGTIEPRVGGKVSFETVGGGTRIESQVRVFDPPRELEYEWNTEDGNGGPVHWSLSPSGSGTRVVFTHHMPLDEFEKWRDMVLAGWHSLFEGLQKAARGEPAPWSKERWDEHHARYKARA